jgi:hypothetical protein
MPQDGDGEVIVRELATGREQRLPLGGPPPPPPTPPGSPGRGEVGGKGCEGHQRVVESVEG